MPVNDSKVATSANLVAYNPDLAAHYVDGAPHLKHYRLRQLYMRYLSAVWADVPRDDGRIPQILDLGAGEGSTTMTFLELGARVCAVDLSASQLDALMVKCQSYEDRLQVHCIDIDEFLERNKTRFDLVVINSLLHHIPDYLALLRRIIPHLEPHGSLVTFQDPLRYKTQSLFARVFSEIAYLIWRIGKGDLWGGLKRRIRRKRGIYLDSSHHDNAEYHVTRGGVDQDAIEHLLANLGFECAVLHYFSTQSAIFQMAGDALGVKNTFGIIARRRV